MPSLCAKFLFRGTSLRVRIAVWSDAVGVCSPGVGRHSRHGRAVARSAWMHVASQGSAPRNHLAQLFRSPLSRHFSHPVVPHCRQRIDVWLYAHRLLPLDPCRAYGRRREPLCLDLRAYERTRSLWLVSIEHALYGSMMFTVGLDPYFYSAAAAVRAGSGAG